MALWGFAPFSPTIESWLRGTTTNSPTVGGFLYVTIASVALGLVINALRWLTIEKIHNHTGIEYPEWDFSRLQPQLGAYSTLVEFYFRYHEFFGNVLIAITFTYFVWRGHNPGWRLLPADLAYVLAACLLWVAGRDTLRKYYQRSAALLCDPLPPKDPSASDPAASLPGPSPAG